MNKIDVIYWTTNIGVIVGTIFAIKYQSILMGILALILLYFGYKTMKRWIDETKL